MTNILLAPEGISGEQAQRLEQRRQLEAGRDQVIDIEQLPNYQDIQNGEGRDAGSDGFKKGVSDFKQLDLLCLFLIILRVGFLDSMPLEVYYKFYEERKVLA